MIDCIERTISDNRMVDILCRRVRCWGYGRCVKRAVTKFAYNIDLEGVPVSSAFLHQQQ